MSITFAESHVDLMSGITFTSQQLANRWEWELEKKWNRVTQDNLRDFMQIKDSVDPETFPGYQQNLALLGAFIADKQTCYTRRVADDSKNALLKSALLHESSLRLKADIELLLNGRAAVDQVLDDQTGEVLVAGIPAVDPLPVESEERAEQELRLAEVEISIFGATQDVLDLVALRSSV